jgi:hypothetical protein
VGSVVVEEDIDVVVVVGSVDDDDIVDVVVDVVVGCGDVVVTVVVVEVVGVVTVVVAVVVDIVVVVVVDGGLVVNDVVVGTRLQLTTLSQKLPVPQKLFISWQSDRKPPQSLKQQLHHRDVFGKPKVELHEEHTSIDGAGVVGVVVRVVVAVLVVVNVAPQTPYDSHLVVPTTTAQNELSEMHLFRLPPQSLAQQ